ncbi:hypothetical protein O6P43_005178 [Quillaja saponaria]|uniref:Uncharacterized protein n=1 Tax=Quillaja saponaria TaxID=32244 RepID=A0AAD7Q5N6_QUISA|nr:hypothetical protein O6P43_005178 [Quillaja saponaria]
MGPQSWYKVGFPCNYFVWIDDEIYKRGRYVILQQRKRITYLEARLNVCKKRLNGGGRFLMWQGFLVFVSGFSACLSIH